ncbi:MAG: hypothetical protein E7312_00665 [Clostridiales bacterium]|nr:hypothetical protein [Clostridiales bacterium]
MAKKYPFGAWVYNPITDFTPDEVDVWADMGLTCTMAGIISGPKDYDLFRQFLDRAQARGIKLIGWVNSITYYAAGNLTEEEYEARFTEVYNALKHPALHGFFVADEPNNPKQVETIKLCLKVQRQVAPELTPFINLMGSSYTLRGLHPDKSYNDFIKDLVEDTNMPSFCFDEYSQSINDGGVTLYYKTFKGQCDAAQYADTDIWATLLSSAHHVYRIPTEYQFTWQITMSAAFGCKGIIWFRLYDRDISPNYHGSPIDEYGDKTEQYDMLKRCHRRFNDQFGEIMLGLKRKKTFIVGFQRGDWPIFSSKSHDCIKAVRSFENGVISFFEDENGVEYMCFVNAQMDRIGHYVFEVDTSKYKLTELLLNGKLQSPADFSEHNGVLLNPGQMVLYRIDKK